MKQKVYLSYAHEDQAMVKALARSMRQQGIETWTDMDLRPGEDFAVKMGEQLRQARTVVFLTSKDSLSSSNAYFELGAAVADQKQIIPVLTHGTNVQDIPGLMRKFPAVTMGEPVNTGRQIAAMIENGPTKIANNI